MSRKRIRESVRLPISGNGSHVEPFYFPLQETPNESNCYFCESPKCHCLNFESLNEEVFSELKMKRIVSTEKRMMCAKSILPSFVTSLAKSLNVTSRDTFYDLGCGNGSVLFQMAFLTGAKCVGVELSPHNAQVAREAWESIRPRLEKLAGKKMPVVEIITGDLCETINNASFNSPHSVIWTANLLMPKMVTQLMAERFRLLPVGARIACFDDMYPHSRRVTRIRDPQAFELFEMVDYKWTSGSVEWTMFEGPYFVYVRK
eukprot:GILI01011448.1.p1 GENE.GILI01011448.1~~GILI01011448.1.p1  ORF type:complete len:288 (-),score=-2.64 GILI01011448.1:49-828(-)